MKNKKHIVCCVTNDLTYDRRMFRICSALSESGFEVTLVGRVRRNSLPFTPSLFHTHRIRCFFNKGFLFYKEYNVRLFLYLLKSGFDILCACDLDTALPVVMSAKVKKKKMVYDAHEYFSEVPELTGRPVVKRIWEWIGRYTIPKFHARYTVGNELAGIMGEVYGVHFDVIRNIAPTPDRKFTPGNSEPRKKIILYQGALNVGRGLEACIEAMRQLPEWSFWLAGEGDITERLKAQTANLGLDQRIKFLGWVAPDDLPALMAKVKISINLREKGSLNDFYSLPNKFFDAIHAGLPSIHMNYPEYNNIIVKYPCAFLLDEVKVSKIVSTINFFDKNPDAWEKMVAYCKMAAKEYTWENEARKLAAIYSKL